MSEIHIISWAGEDTDPALESGEETWTVGWAANRYREHVLDSLADWEFGWRFFAPIPMTFQWDRRERESLSVCTDEEELEANIKAMEAWQKASHDYWHQSRIKMT